MKIILLALIVALSGCVTYDPKACDEPHECVQTKRELMEHLIHQPTIRAY